MWWLPEQTSPKAGLWQPFSTMCFLKYSSQVCREKQGIEHVLREKQRHDCTWLVSKVLQACFLPLCALCYHLVTFNKYFLLEGESTYVLCKQTTLKMRSTLQFSSVQSLSRVWLFATPWIAARQASLSITNSWSSLRLMSIESVMPSSHLILCHPLLLLPPIPPSIVLHRQS